MRFPLDPLLEATGLTPTQASRQCGASGTDMAHAADAGLTILQADHWAIRLGRHPGAIWPEWWDVEPETCSRGHLREGNTYTAPNGKRTCRACNTASHRRHKDKVAA